MMPEEVLEGAGDEENVPQMDGDLEEGEDIRITVHREIFTLLKFCELRLTRKNFSRKNLCRQLVGAVIVGRGILLS